jgi:hypothetical protein
MSRSTSRSSGISADRKDQNGNIVVVPLPHSTYRPIVIIGAGRPSLPRKTLEARDEPGPRLSRRHCRDSFRRLVVEVGMSENLRECPFCANPGVELRKFEFEALPVAVVSCGCGSAWLSPRTKFYSLGIYGNTRTLCFWIVCRSSNAS